MAEYPALPLFTDAFISDTIHLNAAQTGAYLMLLMCAWRTNDCALFDDDDFLARSARMNKRTWLANKDVILSFWSKNKDEKWIQKRLVDERIFANAKRDSAVRAGTASALKRKERHSTDVDFPFQRKSNHPTPTPTKKNIKDNIPKNSKRKITLEELSLDHVSDWLKQKRVSGKYLTVDEFALLEKFRNWCLSSGKKYSDYAAAFRNSFDWENAPKKKAQLQQPDWSKLYEF